MSTANQKPSSNHTFRIFIDAKKAFSWPPPEWKTPTKEWASSPPVAAALNLLPVTEQEAVLRYFRPSDAALSLCSRLLKHYAIARACHVPWRETEVSQERETRNGKPYYKKGGVEFNISHHGQIVALIATSDPGVQVGIDVVQVDKERDQKGLDKEGTFAGWVKIFKDVFSERELKTLTMLEAEIPDPIKFKHFYMLWAQKEAYIKMTGDALMAQWLQQLEFTSQEPPGAGLLPQKSSGTTWNWGDTVTSGVILHGKPVEGVRIEIDQLGSDYMVATAINDPQALPSFEGVKLDESLLTIGTASPDRPHALTNSVYCTTWSDARN